MADTPKTVRVQTVKYHTSGGQEHHPGDAYDVPEDAVENLTAQGMAVRVERAAAAPAKRGRKSRTVTTVMSTRTTRALAKPRGKAKK